MDHGAMLHFVMGVLYITIGDEKGVIIAWEYSNNIVYSACPVQEYIFCISAAYHTTEHIAVVG